jgi:sortase A
MTLKNSDMLLEIACWVIGVVLLVLFLGARMGLESQRVKSIELFSQARATDMLEQSGGDQASIVDGIDSLPLALLRIPRLDLEVPVFGDSSELNLNRGAGWVEGTALPNSNGNMAIAAHRDQHFRPLKDIEIGDVLKLESLYSEGRYQVTSLSIVEPEELWPLDPTDEATVTLITCYPFYFVGNAPRRYIVQAVAMN